MRKLPPLKALRAFEVAAKCTSFTEAAHKLCVTNGAISHQIRTLEDWLGHSLFIRCNGGTKLTETGCYLQNVCTEFFSNIESACASIAKSSDKNLIKVGCSGSFLAHLLIPNLALFEKDFPDINLELTVTHGIDDLLNNKIDALIINSPPTKTVNIHAKMISSDVIGPVCSPAFLSIHKTQDIQLGHLLHTLSRHSAWEEWSYISGIPVDQNHGRKYASLMYTLEAAKNGLGLAIAPELLIKKDLYEKNLVAPFGFHNTGSAIYFCSKNHHTKSELASTLCDWLIDVA